MLSEPLQRKAKHEARLSNISDYSVGFVRGSTEILRFAQNDTEFAIACAIN